MDRRGRQTGFLLGGLLAFSIALAGCARTETQVGTDTIMGTIVRYEIELPAGYSEEHNFAAEYQEIGKRLESDFLSWRQDTSEIYAINQSAGDPAGYPLSEEMERLLTTCLEISEESGGAFDVTIGALTELWRIDQWAVDGEGFTPPAPWEVEEAIACCGYEKVEIRDHRIYLPEGMRLDLGAVGKGYYLDVCDRQVADPSLIESDIMAGGSVLTYSQNAENRTWRIGIVDPFDTSRAIGVLEFTGNRKVATSGNYERFVLYDGRRYHHILDPETGYPAETGLASVTIVSDNGVLADALSTACYVLGPEEGMKLAEQMGADAVFILEDGEILSTTEFEKPSGGSQSYVFAL